MKTDATTLQQMRPLLPVRLLNGCGALLEKKRSPYAPALAVDLIETAKRRCRLDDFGEGDFFEALSRLLESCQREARLNLIGKIALRTDVLQTLCSRLQMERDRQLYPNIAQQEIREPLFIVGLPRSGTTLLHSLLAADPEHRCPLMWEVRSPSPPTVADEKRRIQRATRNCKFFDWLAPGFRYVHAVGAEVPQECISLMTPTFMSDVLCAIISCLVFPAGFAARIRISSPVSSASAVSPSCPPLDIESAYSHVRHAGVAVRLSGCAVCADTPNADRCDGFGIKSGDYSS